MVVAIIGSRKFKDYVLLCNVLDPLRFQKIISGGAKGADSLAERYASECGIPFEEFPADWGKFGKSAGFKRNLEMIENCDMVIAFWDGESRGTFHMIDKALSKDKKVKTIFYNKETLF